MNAALLDYPNANPGDDPRLLAALRVIASAMYDAEMGVEQPKRKKPATGILKKKKPSYFIGMFFIGNLFVLTNRHISSGVDCVNWMRQHLPVGSREEALAIGRELWEHGFIIGDGPFSDSQTRYYFLVSWKQDTSPDPCSNDSHQQRTTRTCTQQPQKMFFKPPSMCC